MNKAELTEAVVFRVKNGDFASHAAAERAVDAVFESMRAALASGEDVTISGFGTLRAVTLAARTSRNPQTGELMSVPERRSVKFRASRKLADGV